MGGDRFPPREDVVAYGERIRGSLAPAIAAVEDELHEFTERLQASKPIPKTLYEGALFAHLASACDVARGVLTLAYARHGELALGVARVSFEQAVSAYWMAIDPESRAKQFEDFIDWEDHQALDLLQTLGAPSPRSEEETRAIIEQKRLGAAGWGRQGWTQRPLRERCTDVATHWLNEDRGRRWPPPGALLALPRFSVLATAMGNRGAHPGARDAVERIRKEGRFVLQFGPHRLTAVYTGYALQIAAWSFGVLGYLVARDGRATDAESWHAHFWPRVERCGEFTGVFASPPVAAP